MMARRWRAAACLLLLQLAGLAQGVEFKIVSNARPAALGPETHTDISHRQSQKDGEQQICSGMYSRKSWGGAVDPYIDVKIVKPANLADNEDPLVSVVIFEWQDRPLIGKQSDPDDPYSKVRMEKR
jgi:hypothetical protein